MSGKNTERSQAMLEEYTVGRKSMGQIARKYRITRSRVSQILQRVAPGIALQKRLVRDSYLTRLFHLGHSVRFIAKHLSLSERRVVNLLRESGFDGVGRRRSPDDLLRDLRELRDLLGGRVPAARHLQMRAGYASYETYRRHFGSWNKALNQALGIARRYREK